MTRSKVSRIWAIPDRYRVVGQPQPYNSVNNKMKIKYNFRNSRGRPRPSWLENAYKSALEKFADEYDMDSEEATDYHHISSNRSSEEMAKCIAKLLKTYEDVEIETFYLEGIKCWGVVIDDSDARIVEYKLRFG